MVNPISSSPIQPIHRPQINAPGAKPAEKPAGEDFGDLLKQQLQQVNDLQQQADQNVQQLVSGGPVNMTDVYVATQKAKVAFSLLMEIRNKLVDAYEDVKNMRV